MVVEGVLNSTHPQLCFTLSFFAVLMMKKMYFDSPSICCMELKGCKKGTICKEVFN